WLDFVFLGIVAVSIVISLVRGFVREVVSVLVWVAAFWISLRYARALAVYLVPWIDSPTLRVMGAFAALFIATLLLGALINFLAGTLVGRTGLTGTDRVLGMVFGGLRGVLIVGLLVMVAGLTAVPRELWWQESLLAAYFRPWVCTVGVGGWLDGLRFYQPVVEGDGQRQGTPVPAYWEEFCGGLSPQR
ncbi:MAG: CvpA family protein, partial [Ectothiorhodospiraceae bacterium]